MPVPTGPSSRVGVSMGAPQLDHWPRGLGGPPPPGQGSGPGDEGAPGPLFRLALVVPVPLPLLGLLVDLLLGDLDELLGEACEAGTSVVLP